MYILYTRQIDLLSSFTKTMYFAGKKKNEMLVEAELCPVYNLEFSIVTIKCVLSRRYISQFSNELYVSEIRMAISIIAFLYLFTPSNLEKRSQIMFLVK